MRNPETTRLYKQFKQNSHCVCCPEHDPVVLEFHHIDPSKKTATIAQLVKQGESWERVLKEIKICVVT